MDWSGPTWIVDPLDGTSNFARGLSPYGTSVAFALDNRPLVGVIVPPGGVGVYWAVRDRGAFVRRRGRDVRLRTSDTDSIARAFLLTGYGYAREGYPAWLERFRRVLVAAQAVRMTGSAVNDFISVARGAADVYWEDEMQPWDWAAGGLLVEESGGRVTDRSGITPGRGPTSIVASNGLLHDNLIEFLNRRDNIT
jgi:myo-inositol-1(or 4)-monophosphatase